MLTCKFGDEEDFEEVSCSYNNDADQILCRRPLRSRRNDKSNDLIGAKMTVSFADQSNNVILQEVSPVITVQDGGGGSIELKQFKPVTGADCNEEVLYTREEPTSSGRSIARKWLFEIILGCVGEAVGTMLMAAIICSILASSIITGSQVGVWQVALPAGLAVALSIYVSSHMSDGHLNPAVTLAFTIVRWKQFKMYRALPHIIAQVLGAFMAAAVVYLFYDEAIVEYEAANNITRGEPGSQVTAAIFARYFPNPLVYDPSDSSLDLVPVWKAVLIEAVGTFILAFVIFSLTHPSNTAIPKYGMVVVPLLIGFTVACVISIFGALTQAGINPAFDFGPCLFATMAGWGPIAIPGPRYEFWVYIIGPFIGGTLGGAASDGIQLIARTLKMNKNDSSLQD